MQQVDRPRIDLSESFSTLLVDDAIFYLQKAKDLSGEERRQELRSVTKMIAMAIGQTGRVGSDN